MQLARYILQIAVPAAFAVIAVLRVFAGLPALTSFRRIWLPWLLVSIVLSGPIVLMYLPSLLAEDVRTIGLGGVHLYGSLLLMMPLVVVIVIGTWWLTYSCGKETSQPFPLGWYHGLWGLAYIINLVVGLRVVLWTSMETFGDENDDVSAFFGVDETHTDAAEHWFSKLFKWVPDDPQGTAAG